MIILQEWLSPAVPLLIHTKIFDDDDDDDDDDYNVIKPGLGQHVSQPQKMAYFSVLKPFYF